MKLTIGELTVVLDTMAASLRFVDTEDSPFRFTCETRKRVLDKILHAQSPKISLDDVCEEGNEKGETEKK